MKTANQILITFAAFTLLQTLTARAAMPAAAPVIQVAAAASHSLFVESDGSLWGMGLNDYSQLGGGNYTETSPVETVASNISAVATSHYHTLLLKSDGSLWAVGFNGYGELGDGTTTSRGVPEEIVSNGVTVIAAGDTHSLFVKSDGSLWGMGRNDYGELGDGTYSPYTNAPEPILSRGVVAVAAGSTHSLFLKSDGSLWSMGRNNYGQLGDGNQAPTNSPAKVFPSGVTAIAAGAYHSLFLKSDGSLWGMGENNYGQLGNGTTNNADVPEEIVSNNVTDIAAGSYHSLFLKSDGSLWAMGGDGFGQLGDGASTNHLVPEKIVSGGVIAIAGGDGHSLYVMANGSLWGMGSDYYGQLGEGDTNQFVSTPEQILFVPFGPTLVANGGFERGDLTGWTTSGNFTYSQVTNDPAFVHSGAVGFEAGPLGSLGYLSQTIATIPGETYSLSFWLENDSALSRTEFLVAWAGQTLIDSVNSGAFGWKQVQTTVLATNSSTVIQFGFQNDYGYFGLDDVRLLPQPDLVLNGGFETGDFTGWTPSALGSIDLSAPHSGNYGAALGGQNLGYLSQTLATTPGATYRVSLWMEEPDGFPGYEFQVLWNGQTLYDISNAGILNWTNLQFTVTATSASTVLAFGIQDISGLIGLDDVSVTPVPDIAGISLAGTNVVIHGSNGQFGGTYSLLSSTDLTTPLNLWTPIGSDIPPASGNFTLTATNAVNHSFPQRFFILQLQ
jgi:alpha-tubulin suppressor-like RCC1 family protein